MPDVIIDYFDDDNIRLFWKIASIIWIISCGLYLLVFPNATYEDFIEIYEFEKWMDNVCNTPILPDETINDWPEWWTQEKWDTLREGMCCLE